LLESWLDELALAEEGRGEPPLAAGCADGHLVRDRDPLDQLAACAAAAAAAVAVAAAAAAIADLKRSEAVELRRRVEAGRVASDGGEGRVGEPRVLEMDRFLPPEPVDHPLHSRPAHKR